MSECEIISIFVSVQQHCILEIYYNMSGNILSDDVRFMADSTEGKDGAKEVIMDYVISWTLRRAQNSCAYDKPILYRYCRKFLGYLLGIELKDSDVVKVETWKQEYRIDLWVWVSVNGVEYDILIEDKYYSGLHDDQLERYKELFDEWLQSHRPKSKPLYWLLTCHERGLTDIYDSAEKYGFCVGFWDDMISAMGCEDDDAQDSESDIFNEFWLRSWW